MRIVGGRRTTAESVRQFTWTSLDRWKRAYELRCESEFVGTLRRDRFAGWRASAETADERWIFRRSGLVHQTVLVHSSKLDLEVAIFEEGALRFTNGRTFLWARGSWLDTNGTTVLRTIGDRVRIDPGVNRLHELVLLIFLAQYLLVADPDGPSAA